MNAQQWLLILLPGAIAIVTAGHALLHKRDPRAAMGWIVVCLMFPLIGPILYVLFGINRIQMRAKRLDLKAPVHDETADGVDDDYEVPPVRIPDEYRELARIADRISRARLVGGNRVRPLHNGEEAYPAMLQAIREAQRSVHLSTYIFEVNTTGMEFVEALAEAHDRGVDVRVIIDGFGELYTWRRAASKLRARGVETRRFIPPKLFPPQISFNLRNHRKILTCDGRVGFTGGMNIGDRHLTTLSSGRRYSDMHFRLEGPVVWQIERIFHEDWRFVAGEDLPLPAPCPPCPEGAICRAIADGPSEDPDRLAIVIAGAISSARERIIIVTPYFLPSRELIGVLTAAALKGVRVQVVLPEKSNITLVHWATRKMLWELLRRGIEIYYQPPPFSHTKLFVIDDHYAQIGSANLDPRSLRLNFELAVELYDPTMSQELGAHADRLIAASRPVWLEEMDARPLPIRIRDALAWLLSPLL